MGIKMSASAWTVPHAYTNQTPTTPGPSKTIIKFHFISEKCEMTQLCFCILPGFEFFETSAKDNINVKQTFERLVDIICDKMSESLETDPAITAAKQNTRLKETPPPPQSSCGC